LTQDQVNVLSQIHQINQQEIQAGKLAQQKSNTSDVKSYGKELEKDHAKADNKVTAFAKKNNVTLSNAPAPANADQEQAIRNQNKSLDQLQGLSGQQFDQNFVSSMETGHNNAIDMVQNAYNSADSGQYKDLLGSILPELRHHEQRAASLEKKFMKKGKF
jgi:putative membrane protein